MGMPESLHIAMRSIVAAAILVTLSSCASELTRTGTSPAYVIVDVIEAASGAEPGTFGNPLYSDVITLVERTVDGQTLRVPTVFSDIARVELRIALKNPGAGETPTAPTTLNSVTLNRYRVVFRRADGRNTQGVDVPYGFDGGLTITIPPGTGATAAFEMVRHQAKQEPPLKVLINDGGAILISTIAEVTFYGRDQVGNEVVATANISVNFGNFGDPQ